MVLATFYVALAPLVVVWELRAAGVVHSPLLSIAAVLGLSLFASSIGSEWWKKRQGSQDVLFGDLIAWSWIRRWRLERRLDEARTLLEGTPDRSVDPASQARLLQALASTLEGRDPYTHGHSRRVARFSVLIAKRMGLPEEMVAKVRTAAAVHDVGKIKVSRAVLNKPGKLTDEEFDLIKRHAEYSARMVERLGDHQITAIVRHHHERLDGTGYPDGLSGEDVPVGSRIIAVADTFDALTSKRPYRRPKSHKAAMDILAREAGTQLDPEAVRAFRGYYSGRRALTLWNGATLLPERLLSALSTALHTGGAASGAQLLTAAAVSTLVGGTAVLSATPPTSAADRAPRRPAVAAPVDAGVPGVQP
ncbi:MAG: HD-GYP domain-containing protein, partial [Actinomycetota bacterium]|nr:HD-GYP domain-containing protein [Actinomycetota bacterium]